MGPLAMVVGDELGQHSPEVVLAERNHLRETFGLARPEKSFRVRVGIGAWRGVWTTRIPASVNN